MPLLRVVVPLEHALILIAPALAVCALVGWWAGGRLALAILWTVLSVWMMTSALPGSAEYGELARGWGVLLAASFGVISMMSPRRTFFPRALAATTLAFGVGLGLMVFSGSRPGRLERTVLGEYTRRAEAWLTDWETVSRSQEWRELTRESPGLETLATESTERLRSIPPRSAPLFPALLALESLAVLALVWALYHRVSRARIGPPLAPLREFRFNDQLVWGLVAGITAVAVPTLAEYRTLGFNLLLFFGVLYALRGLGVLAWFLAPGRLLTALMIGFAIIMWPVLGVFALGVGLGDTWLDWRRRPRPTT